MQAPTSDLDIALAFVIGQVADEANRSGTPLNDEQHYLLTHLPATSELPAWPDPELPPLIPRDLAYETLCTLTKAARLHDLRVRQGAAYEWEFAAAVFKLNRHPMLWVLQWADLKLRRPWWDGSLLIGAAVVVTSCALALMLYAETRRQSWTWLHWIAFGLGCSIIIVCAYLVSREFTDWQIRQTVEKCRVYKNKRT